MNRRIILTAAVISAVAIGFTGPSWAIPLAHGLVDAARYVFETHMVMILDGQSMQFGCF
ncbi:MAG: hypothetical protein HN725_18260 [Alphaproteobacteria bacterium]|jgi:hypothetical protein|nr:hypothetical protein [Alphaproteobacteria bacterium]MBT4085694.1 hypothetical protein [Alphaproteobacteria bacterium]MBT4543517.1 hypothetical protein [Alphaproteobacteria bacterium]MBT7747238.1 hypothetical protein [Alphaproteobacteria bacterium]